MVEAYSRAIMMDLYLSGQAGPETSSHSPETAGGDGFCLHSLHLSRWLAP